MKKTILTMAFLALATLTVRGEVRQVWARGVSETNGWQNTAQWYDGCWAACATDMIAWWKKNLAAKYDVSSLAIGTSEEVNRVFDKNPYFGDHGDYVWKGLEFVFTNSVPQLAITYPKLLYQDLTNAAIYRFYVPHGTATSNAYLIHQRGWLRSEKAKVEEAFKDFINAKGDVIVALGDERHVWVLYGVEYDTETMRLNRIWVTNSSSDTKWTPGLQVFYANYIEGKGQIAFTRTYTVKRIVEDEEIEETLTEQISPHELTYLSVADEVLVDGAKRPLFRKLDSGGVPDPDPVVADDDLKEHNYPYVITRNYHAAREQALREGKFLFVLSGASWCSYCSMVKDHLATVPGFGDDFIVYYASRESSHVYPFFHGGLPQYGAFDPRTINPYAGIGAEKVWANAWTDPGSGAIKAYRGYSAGWIDEVVSAGRTARTKVHFGDVENPALSIVGAPVAVAGEALSLRLAATFPDGVTMALDHRVAWEIVRGEGTISADGVLTPAASSSITVRATSHTFFPLKSAETTLRVIASSDIVGLEVPAEAIDLEETPTPIILANAVLSDGTRVPVAPQTRTVSLVESSLSSPAGFDVSYSEFTPAFEGDTLVYVKKPNSSEKQYYLCDHRISLTLSYGGFTATGEVQVYAPMRVKPRDVSLLTQKTVAPGSVVRFKVGGLDLATKGAVFQSQDTRIADYHLSAYPVTVAYDDASLAMAIPVIENTRSATTLAGKVYARKSGGLSQGWTQASDEIALKCVAPGSVVRSGRYANVTTGYLSAYFPNETADETLATADSDGDGYANWEEFLLGTEPNRADDAFSYTMQHFEALAADEAVNLYYKVMFTIRPEREYTLKAKVNWNDEWQTVGSFTYEKRLAPQLVNASLADNAKFYQVTVGFSTESGGKGYSGQTVTPNGLSFAPGAHLDLSGGATWPLAWRTVAVDDYAPGTIEVTPPESATAGAVLVEVPAANPRHHEALKCFRLRESAIQAATCSLEMRTTNDGATLQLVLVEKKTPFFPDESEAVNKLIREAAEKHGVARLKLGEKSPPLAGLDLFENVPIRITPPPSGGGEGEVSLDYAFGVSEMRFAEVGGAKGLILGARVSAPSGAGEPTFAPKTRLGFECVREVGAFADDFADARELTEAERAALNLSPKPGEKFLFVELDDASTTSPVFIRIRAGR